MSDVPTVVLNNGLQIPALGFGTYPHKERLYTALPAALTTGFRLIDTSDNYGNEAYVGEGIARVGQLASEALLVTKFSKPSRTRYLEHCFGESEARLKRPITLYLLHWPYPHLWKDQWRKMEGLFLTGRCAAIGVCNFEREKMEELLSFCEVKPAVNQFECHPLFQQRTLVDFCQAEGVRTMSYTPVARMDPDLVESEQLAGIAHAHGKTVTQVVLRWNIQHGQIPIPASASPEHIAENFDVFDFVLDSDEMAVVDGLECGKRVRYDPKTRFTTKQKLKLLGYKARLALAR